MHRTLAMLGLLCIALTACFRHEVRVPGYPDSYGATIDAADRGGRLLIWSAIDCGKATPLIDDFRRKYPGVAVDYVEMPAHELNARFIATTLGGRPGPDFLWSSAMDLQIKLVNDGYAQRYISPERGNLPRWANWKDQAWGTTAEPIVLLYNRKLIPDEAVPRDHAALIRLLESDDRSPPGGLASYDLDRSAVGYLYLSQDQQAARSTWRLMRAMGRRNGRVFAKAEEMVRDVASGRSAMAYDIVGSFALDQVRKNPTLGMVLPRDYTLLMSRIAIIPAAAPHPAAARLLLDFLLSRRGQTYLVDQDMPSVRADVPGPAALNPRGAPLRAIRVGPALLVNQDQLTRRQFLRRWRTALHPLPNDR